MFESLQGKEKGKKSNEGFQNSILEKNKAVYRRYIQEIFNEANFDTLKEIISDSYVYHDASPGSVQGPEVIKQVVIQFHTAFPDLEITLDELVAEGDLVCSRATTRGTQKGAFFGIPATGKGISITGLTMVRIVDGKLIESWVKNDTEGLMKQLGRGRSDH